MFWITLTAICAVIVGIGLLIAFTAGGGPGESEAHARNAHRAQVGGRVLAAVGVLVWVLVTAFSATAVVDNGHVGIIRSFGQIDGQLDSGFHVVAPWQDVDQVNVQVQKHSFEALPSFSSETQNVSVSASLNYAVSPDAVQDLYRNVGPSYFDKLVSSRVNQTFKDETVKYRAVDIAPNREKIRAAVVARLRVELAPYSISVLDINIDNIGFSKEFEASIEAKQRATQDALRAQEQVKQAQFEAQAAVERTKGQAQSAIELARGEAEATSERARGQAEANRSVAASLTPNVLQYLAIQKFGDKVQVVLLPSDGTTLIDPSRLLQGTSTGQAPTDDADAQQPDADEQPLVPDEPATTTP